jgi:hypothetical protein
MAVNYTTLLGLAKPQSGTEDGQWGDIVNDQITDLLDTAVAGASSIDVTAGNVTLTDNDGAADQARSAILLVIGTPGTSRNIVAPSRSKVYAVVNGSDGAVVIKGSATTGVTIPAGTKVTVAWNGSDFVLVGGDVTLTGTQTLTNKTLTSPTLTTPVLGTPSSGTLTNCTGLPLSTGVTGTLGATSGGTGQNTYTTGQILYASASNTLSKLNIGSSGQVLTVSGGIPSWQNAGTGSGDVTGPASSTDNAIARFDSTTGKIIQNSGVTIDDSNVVSGIERINNSTIGTANVIFGTDAGTTQTTSFSNSVVIGNSAASNVSANGPNNCVIIGADSGKGNASSSVIIGHRAGFSTSLDTSGSVLVGQQAGREITTGDSNTCVGYGAGYTITTGDDNIMIGQETEPASPTNVASIVIGNFRIGKGSNTAFIGGSAGAYNQANSSTWSTTSDQRIKKNIVNSPKGLAEIDQVQVRNFYYKTPEEMPLNDDGKPLATGLDPNVLQTGFVAQEIQQVFPEAVRTGSDGVLSVTIDPVVYALINAVKELSAEVAALKAQLNGG